MNDNSLSGDFVSKDQEIVEKYGNENPWGMSTCVDLKECNPEIIRDAWDHLYW